MRPLALPAALAAALVAALPHNARALDDYTAPRNATVDARGARRVEIEARAGLLRVVGVEGLSEARVRGTARASREQWLSEITLVARREGDVVVIRAEIPDVRDTGSWGSGPTTRALDLVIEVPRGIDASIDDGSGDAELRGLGDLEVHDGSGTLQIDDVESAVIRDGSGEIRIADVDGDVDVSDGSGSIEVRDVAGSLTISSDSSGSIDAGRIRGDFVVERDGSGGIDYADVRGAVRLPRHR